MRGTRRWKHAILLYIVAALAEAEAIRTRNGVRYAYPITILRDEQGLWKIGAF